MGFEKQHLFVGTKEEERARKGIGREGKGPEQQRSAHISRKEDFSFMQQAYNSINAWISK